MKNIIYIIVLIFAFLPSAAQYHSIPDILEALPESKHGEIYSVGISDSRSEDLELAYEIALLRALSMAVMLQEMTISFVSDYFETRTEEHRWTIITEMTQELGYFKSEAYVDSTMFTVLESDTNTNGEIFILLKYLPKQTEKVNFFVNGEYFRQNCESSQTRSLETMRYLKKDVIWEPNDYDTILVNFTITNQNGNIASKTIYNSIELVPPGFFYRYKDLPKEGFDLLKFNYGTSLTKGAWIAFSEAFIQSAVRISRNYSSRVGTVHDDYDLSGQDALLETIQRSLFRQSYINKLNYSLHGISVHNNLLYPNIRLERGRPPYYCKPLEKPAVPKAEQTVKKQKSSRFLNLFKRKR